MANANIFQQYLQPVRSVTDYAADMDKAEGNKLALVAQRRQNDLAGLQADQTRDTIAQTTADRNALQQVAATWTAGTTQQQRVASLRGTGRPALMTQADALEKASLDNAKTAAGTAKDQAETAAKAAETKYTAMDRHLRDIDFVNTPQDVAAYAEQTLDILGIAPGPQRDQMREQALNQAQTMGLAAWKQKAQQGAIPLLDRFKSDAENARAQLQANTSIQTTRMNNDTAVRTNAATNAVARDRLEYDRGQPKGVVVQTDQGPVMADPRTGNSQPLTLNGETLGPRVKEIPAASNRAILENSQNITKVQQAIDLLEGKNVGVMTGDKGATGAKAYLPNGLLNRIDPSGVDTRAAIADIGSLLVHDRSGAAVTAAETPRLLPFIPLATDDTATAAKKLKRFKQLYEAEAQGLEAAYGADAGYRSRKAPAAGAPAAQPAPSSKVVNFGDLK